MPILKRRPPGWLIAVGAVFAVAAGIHWIDSALPDRSPDPGVTPAFIERTRSRRELIERDDGLVIIRHGWESTSIRLDDEPSRAAFVACAREGLRLDAPAGDVSTIDWHEVIDNCLRDTIAPPTEPER